LRASKAHVLCEDRPHKNVCCQTKYGGEYVLLATRTAGRRRRLEAFCSVHVWDEELPFKASGFVAMMNGEESLWGEGASYKPNSLYWRVFTMENAN